MNTEYHSLSEVDSKAVLRHILRQVYWSRTTYGNIDDILDATIQHVDLKSFSTNLNDFRSHMHHHGTDKVTSYDGLHKQLHEAVMKMSLRLCLKGGSIEHELWVCLAVEKAHCRPRDLKALIESICWTMNARRLPWRQLHARGITVLAESLEPRKKQIDIVEKACNSYKWQDASSAPMTRNISQTLSYDREQR